MATPYEYSPLDDSRNEIRLVILNPSPSFKTEVTCDLVHRFLDSKPPPFDALSYTWGDVSHKRDIFLSGSKFSVTESLNTTLRHLRYADDKRTIWIDALCINQEDKIERSRQVTRMRDIYQKATKVIVWLGPASPTTQFAYKLLSEANWNWHNIENWLPKSLTNPSRSKHWKAFLELTSRDYWRRVWIIQEIFSGRFVIVRCGFHCMRWANFIILFYTLLNQQSVLASQIVRTTPVAFSTFNLMSSLERTIYVPAMIEHFKRKAKEGHFPPLIVPLLAYRNSLSTDARDKVFALIGMAAQPVSHKAFKIDYHFEPRKVMIETIRYLLEVQPELKNRPLNAICCSIPHLSRHNLPTWVPDWSRKMNNQAEMETDLTRTMPMYNSNGNLAPDPKMKFRIEGEVLVAKGIEITAIDHLGPDPVPVPTEQPISSFDLLMAVGTGNYESYFQGAAKLAMADSEDMPHGHKSWLVRREEFFTTLLSNARVPSFNNPGRDPTIEEIRNLATAVMPTEGNARFTNAPSGNASEKIIVSSVYRNMNAYRFCVSSAGTFLMTTPLVHKGDKVCILFGCDMPVVLRKLEEGYAFVGKCYAHGIMQGEAIGDLNWGKYTVKKFRIH
jgi:hypothetical protein